MRLPKYPGTAGTGIDVFEVEALIWAITYLTNHGKTGYAGSGVTGRAAPSIRLLRGPLLFPPFLQLFLLLHECLFRRVQEHSDRIVETLPFSVAGYERGW